MPTPFPGMDPYLEQPGIWKQVHTGLIIDIQKYLARLLHSEVQNKFIHNSGYHLIID